MITEQFLKSINERVIKKPFYDEWVYSEEYGGGSDYIKEEGQINFEGLNDHEKFLLYVFAWNKSEMCPSRSGVMRKFNWTAYKVGKMFKELKGKYLYSVATFSESTGLLSGRGYRINIV